MILQALLIPHVWVVLLPFLLGKQREFVVANIARTIFIHIPVQFLHIIEANLESEEVNSLGKLIDRN